MNMMNGMAMNNPLFLNFMINLMPINTIFQNYEKGIKMNYRNILNLNDKYFIVLLTKHIKENNNNITHYCYLSLFNLNLMEEVNKIEICKINNDSKFTSNIELNDNNIIIDINCNGNHSYKYKFIENELILENNR